jgi:AraC family transcriptional regulator, regulatory protein of adaptative response / methylated-DNA-[protein]-cysteine methyltransferase
MILSETERMTNTATDLNVPNRHPLDEATAWNSVLNRNSAADDDFFYGVTTTHIYCRPSCPSRRPKRENITFFASPEGAERAGFRACLRCRPNRPKAPNVAIQRARDYIDEHAGNLDERITLSRLSDHAGLSPYHLQRKFKQTVGLTPAQYIRARKSEKLKTELKKGETVSRASFGAGYGSSSRAYEDAATRLGMTPATYKRGGAGTRIDYVMTKSSLGVLLVGATERGICSVTLGDTQRDVEDALASEYPAAERKRLNAAEGELQAWVQAVVAAVEGDRAPGDVPIDVQASAFQWKVWRELQRIPLGETRSYGDIAAAIGAPNAVRAVASACANNRVALLIPCHRVIRRSGEVGGYRWGLDRKKRLLEKERAAG